MTPEGRKMHGWRESLDDGFTYVSGKHKRGRVKRPRNRQHAIQCARHDKRSVKAKLTKRLLGEASHDSAN